MNEKLINIFLYCHLSANSKKYPKKCRFLKKLLLSTNINIQIKFWKTCNFFSSFVSRHEKFGEHINFAWLRPCRPMRCSSYPLCISSYSLASEIRDPRLIQAHVELNSPLVASAGLVNFSKLLLNLSSCKLDEIMINWSKYCYAAVLFVIYTHRLWLS